MFRRSRLQQFQDNFLLNIKSLCISINNNITFCQFITQLRQIAQTFFVNNQTIECIANAYSASFGVINKSYAFAKSPNSSK